MIRFKAPPWWAMVRFSGNHAARWEWEPGDLWIGARWRCRWVEKGGLAQFRKVDLWVCFLPMIPLHLSGEVY